MQYKFDRLLEHALNEWPSVIDLSEILTDGGDLTRYQVKGLALTSDEIAEHYIGDAEEIIFRNLHSAIHDVLHGSATFVTRVIMSNLRPGNIRTRFEVRLKSATEILDLGYSFEDIELARRYFAENGDKGSE